MNMSGSTAANEPLAVSLFRVRFIGILIKVGEYQTGEINPLCA